MPAPADEESWTEDLDEADEWSVSESGSLDDESEQLTPVDEIVEPEPSCRGARADRRLEPEPEPEAEPVEPEPRAGGRAGA